MAGRLKKILDRNNEGSSSKSFTGGSNGRRGPIGLQQGYLTVHRGPAEEYWVIMRENGLEFHHRKPLSPRPVMKIDLGELESIVESTVDSKKSSLTLEGPEGTKKTVMASKSKEDIEAWILTIRASEFLEREATRIGHWLPKTVKAIIYSLLLYQDEEFNSMGENIDEKKFDSLVRLGHAANEISIACFRLCLKFSNTFARQKFVEKCESLSKELVSYSERPIDEQSKRSAKDMAEDIRNTCKNLEKEPTEVKVFDEFMEEDPYTPNRKSMVVAGTDRAPGVGLPTMTKSESDVSKLPRPARPSGVFDVKMQTTRERGLNGSFFQETKPQEAPKQTPDPTWRPSSPTINSPPRNSQMVQFSGNSPIQIASRGASPTTRSAVQPVVPLHNPTPARPATVIPTNGTRNTFLSKSLPDVSSQKPWGSTSSRNIFAGLSGLSSRSLNNVPSSTRASRGPVDDPNHPENLHDKLIQSSKTMFIAFGVMMDVIHPVERKSKDDKLVDKNIKIAAQQFLAILDIIAKVRMVTNLPGGSQLTLKSDKIRVDFHSLVSNTKTLLSHRYDNSVVDTILKDARETIPLQIREICNTIQMFLEYQILEQDLLMGMEFVKGAALDLQALVERYHSHYDELLKKQTETRQITFRPVFSNEKMEQILTSMLKLIQVLSVLPAKVKEGKEAIQKETKEIANHVIILVEAFHGKFNEEEVKEETRLELFSCVEMIKNTSLQMLKDVKEVTFSNDSVEMMIQLLSNITRLADLGDSLLNSLHRQVATEFERLQDYEAANRVQDFWISEPDSGNIISEMDEHNQEVIKAATLTKLIERLTVKEVPGGTKFLNAFLTTYRSFTTPAEFFNLLILRYNVKPPSKLPRDVTLVDYVNEVMRPVHLRVFNVMRIWIETSRFDIDKDLSRKIEEFVVKLSTDHQGAYAAPARALSASLAGKTTTSRSNSIAPNQLPTHSNPNIKQNMFKVLPTVEEKWDFNTVINQFEEEKIAWTLTMMDSTLFCSIKPNELLGLAWMKKETKHKSVHVLQLSKRFNQVSNWVISSILSQDKLVNRVRMVEKIIALALAIRKLNNFNTLFAILAALNSSAIHRLKFTMDEVPSKSKKVLSSLLEISSGSNNFKTYRETLRPISNATVPYLGVWQMDLTFIEEGNADMDKEFPHLINFRKRYLVAEVIQQLIMRQNPKHQLETTPKLVALFNQLPLHNDPDKQYTLSLLREPRNADKTDVS